MAKYTQTVQYNLRTTLDSSGISKLQTEIRNTQSQLQKMSAIDLIPQSTVNKAQKQIQTVQKTLTNSFNTKLGMLDISKFSNSLKTSNLSLGTLNKTFELAGTTGKQAFNSLIGRIGNLDTGIKSISKTTDKMFNTIGNTVRWGIIASGFQTILNSLHRSVEYLKELDTSLNNIRIVSEYSAEDMRNFSLYAAEAAKSLGQTTVAYTDASLIFAQQGYNLEDSERLAELTLKVANTTGQQTAEVSEQITSWVNGYQMSIDQLETTLDKVTKVAAVGASDTEELMTAAAKVASTASTLGVTEDQLISQMSTIISVTREAPENVGNALKTIYARLGDLKMGDTLEDGTDLGKLSGRLKEVGVEVLNTNGEMRGMGDILEDLMQKWQGFDVAQKQALAVELAGKYQYNRLMALLENQKMYTETINESVDSVGFLNRTQDIYMDSITARMNSLQAAGEELMTTLFDGNAIAPMLDSLTNVVELLTDLINAIGGVDKAILLLGSTFTKVFSKQMAQGLNNMLSNSKLSKQVKANQKDALNALQSIGFKDIKGTTNSNDLIAFTEHNLANAHIMNEEQIKKSNDLRAERVRLANQELQLEEDIKDNTIATNIAYHTLSNESNVLTYNRDSKTGVLQQDNSNLIRLFNQDPKSMKIQDNQWKSISDNMRTVNSDAMNMQKALNKINPILLDLIKNNNTFLSNANAKTPEYDNAIQSLGDNLQDIEKYVGQDDKALQRMNQTFSNFQSLQTKASTSDDMFKLQKLSEDLESQINDWIHGTDITRKNIQQQVQQNPDTSINLQNQSDELQSNIDIIRHEEKEFTEDIDTKESIDAVLRFVSAIGQLAFAWQSFQSLGSIWANTDITEGEKIEQTIMVLAMTIPTVLSAIVDLQSSLPLLKNGIKQFTNFAVNGFKSAAAAAKSMVLSMGPIGIALTAIAAVATVAFGVIAYQLGEARKQAEEYRDSLRNTLEQEQQISDTIDNSKYTELIKDYKKGTEASKELKQSAIELADALGIEGASTLIATDNFDVLNNKIQQSINKHQELQELASEGIIISNAELNAPTLDTDLIGTVFPGFFTDSHLKSWLSSVSNEDVLKELVGADGRIFNSENAQAIDSADIKAFIPQIVANYNKTLEEHNKLIEDQTKNTQLLNEAIAKGDQEEIDRLSKEKQDILNKIDYNEKLITKYEKAINNENFGIQESMEAFKTLAEEDIQKLNDEILKTTDATQLLNVLTSQDNLKQYLQSGATDAKKLQLALGLVNDELVQQKILIAQSQFEFGEKFADKWNEYRETGQANDLIVNYEQVSAENFEEQGNAVLKRWQDLIDQAPEEKRLQLYAEIDWNKSLPEIAAQIESLSGELPPIEVQGTIDSSKLTNRFEETEESKKSALDDSGMSEEGFNRMSEAYAKDFSKNISKATESLKEYDTAAVKAGVSLNNFDKMQQSAAETGEALAARNVRLNKGVADLVSSWEDLSTLIKNLDWDDPTADTYESIAKLDQILSNILDIDVGTLTEDFYKNADALKAIEELANGSAEAVDKLRALAAEDFIMHVKVTDISETDYQALQNQLLEETRNFQSLLDEEHPIITPEMDDSGLLNHYNQLLRDSQMTAADVTAALSNIGVEGKIEKAKGIAKNPIMSYRVQESEELSGPSLDGGTLGKTITVTPYVSGYVEQEVEYDHLVGATYSGGGISSVGPSALKGNKIGGGTNTKGGKEKQPKQYTPKTKEHIENKTDRYERVNAQLDAIGNDLDKIADEQDRLTGDKLVTNYTKQIKLLERQIDLQKQKLELQKQEAAELQSQLASQYGATFDNEGLMTNANAIRSQLTQEYNNLVAQYNAATTEEQQEVLEKQIDAAQKRLDNFNSMTESHFDLVANGIKQSEKNIEDYYDKWEDLQIEAFNRTIEATDKVKDLTESLIDFRNNLKGLDSDKPLNKAITAVQKLDGYWKTSIIDSNKYYDNLIKNARKRINSGELDESGIAATEKWIKKIEAAKSNAAKAFTIDSGGLGYFDMSNDALDMIFKEWEQMEQTGRSDIFGEDSAALQETAEEVWNQASQLMADYVDELKTLKAAIDEMIDEIFEKAQERLEAYERITDELDHQKSLVNLLYGDKNYDLINQATLAQVDVKKEEMKALQSYISDVLQPMLEETEKELGKDNDTWKNINNQIIDAQSKLNDLAISAAEDLSAVYENTVNKVVNKWADSIFGLDGNDPMKTDLDWMAQQWELINRNAEQYLDEVNSAYEIQKLQNQYLDLLDNTNGLRTQEMITAQMNEQLGILRGKDKLSEYDVAYAQAQLEILQKRLALEEAANNKSQMRLKRDSQGNYRYIYTNNAEDTRDAENDLLDAQNNAYNLSKDAMLQAQQDSLSAVQDAKSLLLNIWTDANLNLEQKQERTKAVIGSLQEYLAGTAGVLKESEQNIINDFLQMCEILADKNSAHLTEVEEGILAGNTEMFNQIEARWNSVFFNAVNLIDNFENYATSMMDSLIDAEMNFENGTLDISGIVQGEWYDMGAAIENTKNKLLDLTSTQADFINQLRNDAGVVADYESILADYQEQITGLNGKMEEYIQKSSILAEKLAASEAKNAQLTAQLQNFTAGNSNAAGYNNNSSGNNGSSEGIIGLGKTVTFSGKYYYDSWGANPSGYYHNNDGQAYVDNYTFAPYGPRSATNPKDPHGDFLIHLSGRTEPYDLGWIHPNQIISAYKTGGYTGTWSRSVASTLQDPDNGRLAFLHQKELVLNETDTANILMAVRQVRALADNIRALEYSTMVSDLNDKMNSYISKSSELAQRLAATEAENKQLEQQITINADFPAAGKAAEIEEALVGLTQKAQQYAHQNKTLSNSLANYINKVRSLQR